MRRRPMLLATALLAAGTPHASALPPRPLQFPRDHGAHPDLRTEWWYVTGHATAGAREFGFQVTFFRSRVDSTQAMGSRFAARQLLFAHAAVTDVQGRKLWHDQRIARAGFGIAQASEQDALLRLRDWTLERRGDTYLASISAADFSLQLTFRRSQPVLLQGFDGLSRKGPETAQASYYYSIPQLETSGRIAVRGQQWDTRGKAWLDHEWSEALMHPQAVGWDWIGMNLDDGGALTAFRLRRADGSALWDGGSFRAADGSLRIPQPRQTRFMAGRRWTSAATNASYPVEWQVQTPAGLYSVRAVIDNQELDSRASTGAIYWEGLADLLDAQGRRVGRGYLEMTGYAQRLRL